MVCRSNYYNFVSTGIYCKEKMQKMYAETEDDNSLALLIGIIILE